MRGRIAAALVTQVAWLGSGVAEPTAGAERGSFVLGGRPVSVEYELMDGDVVVGGDLIVDPADAYGFTKSGSFWPGGIVPYTIDSSVRSTHRGYIEDAIREFEEKTAVDWVPRNGEDAFVQFVELDNNACRAEPGYTGGRRQVKLRNGSTYCNVGVVTHEMGHALGLLHEQNRSDRSQYVQNLDGCLDGYDGDEIGRFDICSTMLYRSSTLGSCHIKLKPGTVSDECPDSEECPGTSACSLYHNWATLSKGDVAMMNHHYPPPDVTAADAGPDASTPIDPDQGASGADGGPQDPSDVIGGCGVGARGGGGPGAFALVASLAAALRRKSRRHRPRRPRAR